MRRRIKWQHHAHPLGGGPEWEEGPAPEVDEDDETHRPTPVRPILMTAAGVMPANVYGDISRNFRFWIGHTSFVLDESEPAEGYVGAVEAIKSVPGVETLEVLTPYRFRMGVGLAFDGELVKWAVQEALDAQPRRPPEHVLAATEHVRKGGGRWCAYELPSGAVDACRPADADAFLARVALYEAARELAGGEVYTADDLR